MNNDSPGLYPRSPYPATPVGPQRLTALEVMVSTAFSRKDLIQLLKLNYSNDSASTSTVKRASDNTIDTAVEETISPPLLAASSATRRNSYSRTSSRVPVTSQEDILLSKVVVSLRADINTLQATATQLVNKEGNTTMTPNATHQQRTLETTSFALNFGLQTAVANHAPASDSCFPTPCF